VPPNKQGSGFKLAEHIICNIFSIHQKGKSQRNEPAAVVDWLLEHGANPCVTRFNSPIDIITMAIQRNAPSSAIKLIEGVSNWLKGRLPSSHEQQNPVRQIDEKWELHLCEDGEKVRAVKGLVNHGPQWDLNSLEDGSQDCNGSTHLDVMRRMMIVLMMKILGVCLVELFGEGVLYEIDFVLYLPTLFISPLYPLLLILRHWESIALNLLHFASRASELREAMPLMARCGRPSFGTHGNDSLKIMSADW